MKLVTRHCPHSYSDPVNAAGLAKALLDAVSWAETWEVPLDQARSTRVQLCLRALANLMGVYLTPRDLSWVPEVCSMSLFVLFVSLSPHSLFCSRNFHIYFV